MGKVVILHPDLGIGGAERLIVDAATALQDCGHQVQIFTNHHDPGHCFEETRNGTLQVIQTMGWLPRHVFGKFHALLANIKMILMALHVLMFAKYDIVICDQVSACLPFLKKFNLRNKHSKLVYYCHFPDLLLTKRDTTCKQIYRKFIDWVETAATGHADILLVNSEFTKSVVKATFPDLSDRNWTVLYPCVDLKKFDKDHYSVSKCSEHIKKVLQKLSDPKIRVFLSINRFEEKKELDIAIDELAKLIKGDRGSWKFIPHLVIAGGYDPRLNECVRYRKYLQSVARRHFEEDADEYVTFVESPSDNEKLCLLDRCDALIYTPQNEHFGIVPLEAMAMNKPVYARKSGGPLETVEHGKNGLFWQLNNGSETLESHLWLSLVDEELLSRLGKAGRARVRENFSYEVFRNKLERICFPQDR